MSDAVSKINEAQSEIQVFLPEAQDAMEVYYRKAKKYADAWFKLDIVFVNGPFHLRDKGIRPTEAMGNRWRPKGCKFTYHIINSGLNTYRIIALGEDGKPKFFIEPGMKEPAVVRE